MTEKIVTTTVKTNDADLNRDPLTGTPGAHPLGTGAGAASGGVAGAAVGTVMGGPVGAVVGAAIGAVAGGLAGKSAAESVNPTAEEVYWRETYIREPYFVKGRTYDYYAPAYRTGWEGRARYAGRTFEEAEPDLQTDYGRYKTPVAPDWKEGRLAARSAWTRVDQNWKVGT